MVSHGRVSYARASCGGRRRFLRSSAIADSRAAKVESFGSDPGSEAFLTVSQLKPALRAIWSIFTPGWLRQARI